MMHNHPFFRNHVTSSFPFESTTNTGGYHREAPIRQRQPNNEFQQPSPKIISIPVHFVESENTRLISAVRIQKVFRGFLVRKNVKKIFTIKREVDGIEIRISETVDLIRKDGKERLKVNEMLMALLFKLDSVRGIDSGVRDCRKSVIKKAIVLQEKLDSIANGNADDQTLVSSEEHLEETAAESDDTKEAMEMDTVEQDSEICECNAGKDELNSQEESVEEKCEILPESEEKSTEVAAVDEGQEKICLESENKDGSIEEDEEGYLLVKKESNEDDAMEEVEQADLNVEEKVEKSDEKKELLEKMMKRNEVLIGLVADLCEKNKMQTQMISSLTKRVDCLEKAFKCDRSKCKKRK